MNPLLLGAGAVAAYFGATWLLEGRAVAAPTYRPFSIDLRRRASLALTVNPADPSRVLARALRVVEDARDRGARDGGEALLELAAADEFLATFTEDELSVCGQLAGVVAKELFLAARRGHRGRFLSRSVKAFQASTKSLPVTGAYDLRTAGAVKFFVESAPAHADVFLSTRQRMAEVFRGLLEDTFYRQVGMEVLDWDTDEREAEYDEGKLDQIVQSVGRQVRDSAKKSLRAFYMTAPERAMWDYLAAGYDLEVRRRLFLALGVSVPETGAFDPALPPEFVGPYRDLERTVRALDATFAQVADEARPEIEALLRGALWGVADELRRRSRGKEWDRSRFYDVWTEELKGWLLSTTNPLLLPAEILWVPPRMVEGQITVIELERAYEHAVRLAVDVAEKSNGYDRELALAFQDAFPRVPKTGYYDPTTAAAVRYFYKDARPGFVWEGTRWTARFDEEWRPPRIVPPTVARGGRKPPEFRPPEKLRELRSQLERLRSAGLPAIERRVEVAGASVGGIFGWVGKIAAGIALFAINPFGGLANLIALEVVDRAAPSLMKAAALLPQFYRAEARREMLSHLGRAGRLAVKAALDVLTNPVVEVAVVATVGALTLGSSLLFSLGLYQLGWSLFLASEAAILSTFVSARLALALVEECVLEIGGRLEDLESLDKDGAAGQAIVGCLSAGTNRAITFSRAAGVVSAGFGLANLVAPFLSDLASRGLAAYLAALDDYFDAAGAFWGTLKQAGAYAIDEIYRGAVDCVKPAVAEARRAVDAAKEIASAKPEGAAVSGVIAEAITGKCQEYLIGLSDVTKQLYAYRQAFDHGLESFAEYEARFAAESSGAWSELSGSSPA